MGTTLLGVDLDEAPLGGLVERLLTDEELEALTDGGRDRDESEGDDSKASDAPDDLDDDSNADATDSSTALDGDSPDEDDSGDSTVGGGTVGTPGRDFGVAQETPRPDGVPGASDDEDGDEDGDGIGSTLRAHWKKLVAAVVALALLGVVAWKYGGTIAGAVKGKLGRGDAGDGDAPDVGPAGRTPPGEPVGVVDDAVAAAEDDETDEPTDEAETGATVGRPTGGPVDDSPTTDDATNSGTDTGALVGLAALALVAALVRKFGEDRPRDPLVDGPVDDEP